MIDVLYFENKEHLFGDWLHLVEILFGEFEKEKFLRYRRWQDKQAYLLGRLLLSLQLSKHGYKHDILKSINYTTFNRPFIKEINADFSISHSGEYVVCAFSEVQKVGVDIEHIQLIDFENFSYILSVADKEAINRSVDKFRTFFNIWSAKEAILKAHGCGLAGELDKLEISDDTGLFDGVEYTLKPLNIDNSYSSFIASDSPFDNVQIEKVSYNSCLKSLG